MNTEDAGARERKRLRRLADSSCSESEGIDGDGELESSDRKRRGGDADGDGARLDGREAFCAIRGCCVYVPSRMAALEIVQTLTRVPQARMGVRQEVFCSPFLLTPPPLRAVKPECVLSLCTACSLASMVPGDRDVPPHRALWLRALPSGNPAAFWHRAAWAAATRALG